MTTLTKAFTVPSYPSLDSFGQDISPTMAAGPIAGLVESTELFRGNKAVGILHNGSLYRLQATKLG